MVRRRMSARHDCLERSRSERRFTRIATPPGGRSDVQNPRLSQRSRCLSSLIWPVEGLHTLPRRIAAGGKAGAHGKSNSTAAEMKEYNPDSSWHKVVLPSSAPAETRDVA